MYIGDWLARREMLTPDKVALIDTLNGDRPFTYRQWNRLVNQTANYLREHCGVHKGDRVAVLALNSVEYLNLWFACGKLGAILQTLNWRLTTAELAGLIQDGTPTVLFFDSEFNTQVESLKSYCPQQISIASLESQISTRSDWPPPAVELNWQDPWAICYTGGTTGLPKGAVLTHGSITANSVNTVMSWGLTSNDVAILNAPLFHTGGLNVFTAPLVHLGGTTIVCRSFDPDQVFDLIARGDVTLFFGVPTMFITLQQHPRWATANFSKLKIVISGGAPCPLPVFEKFWARGVHFKTGYGLTEAGPNTFWLPPADVRRKPGAVGFPLMHVDVKIVREDDTDCEAEEVGELLIRGPHVCAGYWNRPTETEQLLRRGWLATGDLARKDSEGYYYIVGRNKDIIISGGENIYPAEVENVLAAHPAVTEATLIGLPDDTWGEVGGAVVVVANGQALTAEQLQSFCMDKLAKFKIPKRVFFVDSLPKTGAGKVDKKLLSEKYSG